MTQNIETIEPPRYKHDNCSKCIFLGQYGEYDLYFCPDFGTPPVIARYGDGGNFISERDLHLPAFKEAQNRASKMGLL